MRVIHLNAGRWFIACTAFSLILGSGHGIAGELFPFDQELLLDATPMRPGKRMPILTVEPNGDAKIDLWCRTVSARMEFTDAALKLEPGPLPEDPPAVQSAGQCTPERMQADAEMLAALAQVTGWRREGDAIVLIGAKPLRFRPATN